MVLKVTGSSPVNHLIMLNFNFFFFESLNTTTKKVFLWYPKKKYLDQFQLSLDYNRSLPCFLKNKKRFLMKSKDFTKIYIKYHNVTFTTGLFLVVFDKYKPSLRRHIVLLKFMLKFFKIHINSIDFFFFFRPICWRINLFILKYNQLSDWYLFYV